MIWVKLTKKKLLVNSILTGCSLLLSLSQTKNYCKYLFPWSISVGKNVYKIYQRFTWANFYIYFSNIVLIPVRFFRTFVSNDGYIYNIYIYIYIYNRHKLYLFSHFTSRKLFKLFYAQERIDRLLTRIDPYVFFPQYLGSRNRLRQSATDIKM